MKLHNEEEARIFESALDKCEGPVFAITADGRSYNLNSYEGRIEGFARMFSKDENDVEIFDRSFRDFLVLSKAMRQIPGAVA